MGLRLVIILLLTFAISTAQEGQFTEKNLSVSKHVDGTFLMPVGVEQPKLAILIAGSGPIDRDGNQNFMQTNSMKKLAHALGKNGIASFRYDKRVVKQIRTNNIDKELMFDDFVDDAKSVIAYFRPSEAFSSIIIIGHSQGSLVGMLSANDGVDGFISLAGAGKSIDKVITEQVERTAPMFVEDTRRVFTVLGKNETTTEFPPALQSIFNLDIQPFMSNWMQYDPAAILAELEIPTLVVNGTKDLQIDEDEAKLLSEASPEAELAIIDNMNHVLVIIKGDDLENSKSYNEPFRKLSPELVESITTFIVNLQ